MPNAQRLLSVLGTTVMSMPLNIVLDLRIMHCFIKHFKTGFLKRISSTETLTIIVTVLSYLHALVFILMHDEPSNADLPTVSVFNRTVLFLKFLKPQKTERSVFWILRFVAYHAIQ